MRKRALAAVILTIISTLWLSAQGKYTRQQYIDMYKDIAIEQMRSHGIPASITLAQGCLESGDGNSYLAVEANNHFGIKCHTDWKGPSVYRKDDHEYKDCFRKYKHVKDSYDDHGNFLRYRDRYAFLFDLDITDYKGWAQGLKKAGYATNPQYAQMLIKIIEDYKLYEYDHFMAAKAKKEKGLLPPSPAELEAVKQYKPAVSSPLYKFSMNRTLYVQNGVVYVIANDGDTYKQIAMEYNLFTREILRFNDLKKDGPVEAGTVVYIEKKKKKAQRHLEVHIAEEGDTYRAISQRYAVRMKWLLKYNGIKKDQPLAEGEEVYLRTSKY